MARAAGVPAQTHATLDDPWREQEEIDEAVRDVEAGGGTIEVFDYPGSGHLFTDPTLPDEYDATTGESLRGRRCRFVGVMSACNQPRAGLEPGVVHLDRRISANIRVALAAPGFRTASVTKLLSRHTLVAVGHRRRWRPPTTTKTPAKSGACTCKRTEVPRSGAFSPLDQLADLKDSSRSTLPARIARG